MVRLYFVDYVGRALRAYSSQRSDNTVHLRLVSYRILKVLISQRHWTKW